MEEHQHSNAIKLLMIVFYKWGTIDDVINMFLRMVLDYRLETFLKSL